MLGIYNVPVTVLSQIDSVSLRSWGPQETTIFLFFFLGLQLWHMEISQVIVESKMQLLALHHSNVGSEPHLRLICRTTAQGNTESVTHSARLGIKPASSWILVGFLTCWVTVGTLRPLCLFKKKKKKGKFPFIVLCIMVLCRYYGVFCFYLQMKDLWQPCVEQEPFPQ